MTPQSVALSGVTKVACGVDFTAWLTQSKVYTAGCGQYGQLGDGSTHEYNCKDCKMFFVVELLCSTHYCHCCSLYCMPCFCRVVLYDAVFVVCIASDRGVGVVCQQFIDTFLWGGIVLPPLVFILYYLLLYILVENCNLFYVMVIYYYVVK